MRGIGRRAYKRARETLPAAPTPADRPHQMLACLWCPPGGFTAKSSAGLLIHITGRHAGETLGELQVRQMGFHNKRMCQQCGVLRAGQSRQCQTCGQAAPTREVKVGDTIADRSGLVARTNGRVEPAVVEEAVGNPEAAAQEVEGGGRREEHQQQQQQQQAGGGQLVERDMGGNGDGQQQGGREQQREGEGQQTGRAEGGVWGRIGRQRTGPAVDTYLQREPEEASAEGRMQTDRRSRWGDRAEGGAYWRIKAPGREVAVPHDLVARVTELGNGTCEHVPMCLRDRFAITWAESIEGTVAGSALWAELARCRARLLLTWVGSKDKIGDIRRRLDWWEHGQIDRLIRHVEQRKNEHQSQRDGGRQVESVGAQQERQGKKALKLTVKECYKKATMAFSTAGNVRATPEEKQRWTDRLIPRREAGEADQHHREEGLKWGKANLRFGASDAEAYRFLAKNDGGDTRVPLIPMPRFAALSAPGPSGERAEHLAECLETRRVVVKRRLHRALDHLTVRAARGTLPKGANWLLHTQLTFLKKDREGEPGDEEDAWLWRFLEDGGGGGQGDGQGPTTNREEAVAPQGGSAGGEGGRRTSTAEPDEEPGNATRGSEQGGGGGGTDQDKPPVRPIQMGEVLRKVASKRILGASKGAVDAACINARQWGVGATGGAEGIIHAHLALERLHISQELSQPIALIQVDAENCFGRLEWDSIREAVTSEAPELGGWIGWKHSQTSHVEQQGIPPTNKDRGAEQGDTCGPVEAGICLSQLGRRARQEVHARQLTGEAPRAALEEEPGREDVFEQAYRVQERAVREWEAKAPIDKHVPGNEGRGNHPGNKVQAGGGIVDVWYLDDATIMTRPWLVSGYLRAYDRLTTEQGGRRNKGKTLVTVYGPANSEDVQKMEREIEGQCTVCSPGDPGQTLGVATGGRQARIEQLRKKCKVIQVMHDRLRRISKTGAELVLAQACFGVDKVTHLLRAAGDELFEDQTTLTEFDAIFEGTLRRLIPGVDEFSLRQAGLGLRAGGLGVRKASDIALPAVIASRAMARPKIQELDEAMEEAGLLQGGQLLGEHDRAAREAVRMLQERLDSEEAEQVADFAQACEEGGEQQWEALKQGLNPQGKVPRAGWSAIGPEDNVPQAWRGGGPREGEDAEGEGPAETGRVDEITDDPGKAETLSPVGVQRQLSLLVDCSLLRRLVADLAHHGKYSDQRRLQELRDPTVDHTWLQRLDYTRGPVLHEADLVIALQLRLGAHIMSASFRCAECGGQVDSKLSHAGCCAKAERTRGHNATARVLFDRMVEVDKGCSLEAQGLSTVEPGARPADLLTTAAVPNREAALDVTIVSQEASHAGRDCVAAAQQAKFDRYRATINTWDPAVRVFQPLVWSHEGRCHPDTCRVLSYTSTALARQVGGRVSDVLRRWNTDIGVVLAARRARMARACLPQAGARSRFICWGQADEDIASRRAMEGGLGAYLAEEGGEEEAGESWEEEEGEREEED